MRSVDPVSLKPYASPNNSKCSATVSFSQSCGTWGQ
jgi:hypothetical protein